MFYCAVPRYSLPTYGWPKYSIPGALWLNIIMRGIETFSKRYVYIIGQYKPGSALESAILKGTDVLNKKYMYIVGRFRER